MESSSKMGTPSTFWVGQPFFLVLKQYKPEDPWRPVIDYRAVNNAAEKDSYTIPLIEDILIRQGRKKLWCVLDLKDASPRFHWLLRPGPYSSLLPLSVTSSPQLCLRATQMPLPFFNVRWIFV
jgi:hypothetical protein